MSDGLPERDGNKSDSVVVQLFLMAVLLVFCGCVPLFLARIVHPILGVLSCFFSFWSWARIGPPPSRGFLNGLLSINGFAVIVGVLIKCVCFSIEPLFE